MRRLALVAAALALACSSNKDEGDRSPPAAPIVSAPATGERLDATDLVAGQVEFTGSAEPGATVAIRIDGLVAGTVAAADGVWSFAATLASGPHTVSAVATDAAGNASAPSATVSFTLDLTRLASPLPATWPRVPVTSFAQSVPDGAGLGVVFPDQANTWVLDRDFSLANGFGLQYVTALALYTGTPAALTHAGLVQGVAPAGPLAMFPYDQAASEAVFLTPGFGVSDGVAYAAASDGVAMGVPALSATRSGYLNGTSSSDLWRRVSLTPLATYTFSWSHRADLRAGALVGASAAPHAPAYEVALVDATTLAPIGEPLFSSAGPSVFGTASVTRTMPSELPAEVALRFHLRSAAEGYAAIDDVAIADVTAGSPGVPLPLPNGDFEAGDLSGWLSTVGGDESQNVRSGARDLGAPALRVTRTFYAPPAATWGRLVDVFENTGAAPVTTKAVYLTVLAGGAPFAVPSQGGAAVVGWDGNALVRDVGIVLGSGAAFVEAGDPRVFVVHDVSVPPGGRVALVHFVVQLGLAEGGATVPLETDLECGEIAAGFPMVETYRLDLEPGVIDLVTNF